MNLDYLNKLGYSDEEIEKYSHKWNNHIIEFLAENSEFVAANMEMLTTNFDKELLLKLPIFYSETFVSSPSLFESRINLLKNTFPDEWEEIIEKQFWGYDGYIGTNYVPIMSILCSNDITDVEKSIVQLQNPSEIVFEFMILLSKKLSLNISTDGIIESLLWDLEVSKYEVEINAKFLVEKGLTNDLIEELIYNAPFLMMQSKLYVEKCLIKGFGEDYIAKIQSTYSEDYDSFLEILEDIAGSIPNFV